MILLAFGKQDVLLDVVQDAVERLLRDRGEEVEWRLRAGDVHPLDDAPFEYRAWQALLRATTASVPLRSPALNRETSSCALPGRICLSVMSSPEYDVGIEMMCLIRGSNAAARIDM